MSKVEKMKGFLNWYKNKIKSPNVITNETFILILEKI